MLGQKIPKKRLYAILIPISLILLALIIAVTSVMNYYTSVMDLILGKGTRSVVAAEGTESWNTEYYDRKYSSEEKAYENAMKVSKQIASEGDVLLKNNGVLPLAKNTRISPMGYRFISPNYGASHGSAAFSTESAVSPEQALGDVFTLNQTVVSALKSGTVTYMNDSSYETTNANKMMQKGAIMEYEPSVYDDGVVSSLQDTVGIVFIGRQAGETYDIPRYTYYDGTVTGLGISAYERAAIEIAKKNCDKLIVVLNGPHPLQISELMTGELEADAIIWAAAPALSALNRLRIFSAETSIRRAGRSISLCPLPRTILRLQTTAETLQTVQCMLIPIWRKILPQAMFQTISSNMKKGYTTAIAIMKLRRLLIRGTITAPGTKRGKRLSRAR